MDILQFDKWWSSYKGRTVDALVSGVDEGRGRLRKASGSRQTGLDPGISEWGNPPGLVPVSCAEYIGAGGERGELKHLSTLRKRKQPRFPK